ncbi:MAG: FHA domain-containing protein [Candidatus Aminicenantes bacterium]|nr:FHA domain-containing protein [Candidatus Aminicenantes bacterium]
MRPSRPRGGAKISARLDIFYADGGSKSVRLAGVRTTIGRAGDNAVPLSDPVVSGRHAEIVAQEDGFLLRDLGSSNGTFVNGQAVTETPLYAGDEIVVGTTRLVLGE